MKIKNSFIQGKMNKDIDERLLPEGQYPHAENIRVSTSEGSDGGAIENILGNEQLTQFNFGDNPICIGMYSDSFSDSLFWFVKSDSGSFVCEYNERQGTYSRVLSDTRLAESNVLNFSSDYLITGVNVIVDSDNNVVFLLWTDDLNPPRMINLNRAKAYAVNGFDDSDISLIKSPPLAPPSFSLSSTETEEENNLEERFLRFATRFEYLDGEKSALSSFTEVAFKAKPFLYDYSTSSNESMVNNFNSVLLSFETGGKNVKSVDVVFKESGSSDIFLVESYNKSKQGWDDDDIVNINFINDKTYEKLPEQQLFRLYDAVPLLAKAQEMIGNRIVFGNYTSDYNIEDCDGNPIAINFSLEQITTPITDGVATESLKTTRNYEVVQVYMDGQGRMTTGLPSKNNTIHIPNIDCDKQNQIKVVVEHKAPCFAEKFRFFLKQSRYDYDTLVPTLFYEDGVYRWIKVESNDVSKISEGDYLYVKSDSRDILSPIAQTKVLEIKQQERNFLEDPSETSLKQVAGNYFKIKPTGFRLNIDDFTNYEFTSYDSSSNKNDNPIRSNTNVIEPAVYYGIDGIDDLTEGGAYTGSTDIRYLIEIISAGATDEFRWSDDNGTSWSANIPITGAAQAIDEGITVTFGATTGHNVNDSWVVSAKSSVDNGFGGSENSKAYAIFKSLDSNGNINDDDVIQGGARITIIYDEYNEGNEYFEKTYTSSTRYANLEEWFYGDNVLADLGVSDNRIWFRRGVVGSDSGTEAKHITIDPTGDMCMIILSSGTQNNDADSRVKVRSTLNIFQSEQNIIFETKEILKSSDVFYEIGRTYDIDEDRNHLGYDSGDVDQETGVNGEFVLPVFNCFAWGNGFESYKIKDSFNAVSFKIDTRASGILDNYRQNKRISSLTYSEVYEQSTNYNGLNEFNLSLANYKDMDDKYNSIQKLFSKDTDLTVFQEDKVHRVLYNKDVLFDADGSGNIRESTNVLGQEIPFAGEFGISREPESHAFYGNFEYWTDTKRGVVCRKGLDGITEISRNGMTDWFRDNFRENNNSKKVGAYDVYHDEYIIMLDDVEKEESYTVSCGTSVSKYKASGPIEFYVNLEKIEGTFTVDYVTDAEINITVLAVQEDETTNLNGLTGTGSEEVSTPVDGTSLLKVTVTPVGAEPTFEIGVSCVVPAIEDVIANDDTVLIITGDIVDTNVLANDVFVNPVTVTIISQGSEGTASVNPNNTIKYTHDDLNTNPDSYVYQIDDGNSTDTATVNITVKATGGGGGETGQEFSISSDSYYNLSTDGEGACGFILDNTAYHDGVFLQPTLGDFLFEDAAKTIPFAGGDRYWLISNGVAIRVLNNGEITGYWICGAGEA